MIHHFYLDPLHSSIHHPGLFNDFPGLDLEAHEYGSVDYDKHFDAAYNLITNSGRYGTTTRERLNVYRSLMRNDAYNCVTNDVREARASALPVIVTAAMPESFDEDAEVRTGGTLAVALMLPSPEGWQVVLAVQPSVRRRGLGGMMLYALSVATSANVYTWVNRANADAMSLLADRGWAPTSVDASGNARWSRCGTDRSRSSW